MALKAPFYITMLVIRLQRVGKKKQAAFRVVLQEHTWSPQGKAKELLGFYNPIQKEKKFHTERVKYWLSKGAQPSPTVHNLMIDAGILTGAKKKAWSPKPKSEKKKAAEKAVAEKKQKKEEGNEGTPTAEAPTEPEIAVKEEVLEAPETEAVKATREASEKEVEAPAAKSAKEEKQPEPEKA